MSISLFTVSLQGCASGNWANYSYGPEDWLSDSGFGDWNTMYNYQKIFSLEIRLHYVENPAELCGSFHARGCARLTACYCDIWIHNNHKGLRSTTKYDTATAGIISVLIIQRGHREVVNRGIERNRERAIGP